MRKQTGISSGNSLAPVRRQAIIWTDAGLLLLGPLGTNFSEIRIKIQFEIYIQENDYENVCKMAAILSRLLLTRAW